MVAPHARSRSLSRPHRGIFFAPGHASLSPRRNLARLFLQIRGVESAAQENAPRFEQRSARSPAAVAIRSSKRAREEAATNLHQGQCNDPYWHGIFGGLYSPHLRTAVWGSLIRAEAIADRLVHRRKHYSEVARLDFDADGREELYFTSERYAILVHPC